MNLRMLEDMQHIHGRGVYIFTTGGKHLIGVLEKIDHTHNCLIISDAFTKHRIIDGDKIEAISFEKDKLEIPAPEK